MAETRSALTEDKPTGIDISNHQGNVDWGAVAGTGMDFAYVKATEGTGFQNSFFAQQYVGAYNAGLIRGAYHYALPDRSGGASQANFFVDHGGGWSRDNKTLPGALDIEYNPYGPTCYGLSTGAMVAWIHDFANQFKARTSRDVVIYTNANWWNNCTGGSTAFGPTNALWVAHYGVANPTLPTGWSAYTFWQHSSTGRVPGVGGGTANVDLDVFNGDPSRLLVFANGCAVAPRAGASPGLLVLTLAAGLLLWRRRRAVCSTT